jgi:peptidoglycan hydrolase-like protein with peptidoglycan-binding domain
MDSRTIQASMAASSKYKVPLATVLGVVEQESAGIIFAKVDGRDEPVVRHEGHYLHKRLKGAQLEQAIKKGLASRKVGGVKNPSSQQARWDKLLRPAMAINKPMEVESVSWGVGQVMGAHWAKLGFTSAEALMDYARSGIEAQIDIMMRYCKEFKLIDELQRGDFVGFTRGYNGTGAVGSYSTSMEKKAKAWAKKFPAGATTRVSQGTVDGINVVSPVRTKNAQTMLRMGTEGAAVRQLQSLLVRAGYAVEVDGDFGPDTKDAVMELQAKHGLEVDGIAGPQTLKLLDEYKVDPEEQPGVPGPAEAVVQTPEGRQGAVAAIGAGSITAAIDPARDALLPLVGTGGPVDTIYAVMTVAGVAITLGGIAWAGYGWWRANSTRGVKHA